VSPNALGSSFGSTNAASVNPMTGKPYGSRLPEITVKDIVAGQRSLLEHLGIRRLVAVIGPSFGGAQVFQWGVDYPDDVAALIAVLTAPSMRGNPAEVAARLASAPQWQGGDYYETGGMDSVLEEMRINSLLRFGIDSVLEPRIPDQADRARELRRLARDWAKQFDANSLLILMKAMASFNVVDRLQRIRAPLLYVLSRSDSLFPPSLAPQILQQLKDAGVRAQYFEIDSDYGHFASSVDAAKWTPTLREFLQGPGRTLVIPATTREFDWEIELAVIISRKLKNADLEAAAAGIAGYSVGLDMTCRNPLERDSPTGVDLVRAKAQDGVAPVGPFIRPSAFIRDVQNLRLKLFVNGEIKQNGCTADMLYSVPEQLSTISRYITLEPGDIVFTGSPAGSGASIGQFLHPGDRIEAEIEGVGRLDVEVVAPVQ
jgi:homoserine O-acetyltransferase